MVLDRPHVDVAGLAPPDSPGDGLGRAVELVARSLEVGDEAAPLLARVGPEVAPQAGEAPVGLLEVVVEDDPAHDRALYRILRSGALAVEERRVVEVDEPVA